MLKRSQPVVLIWAPCWCGQGGGHGHESGGPPAAAAAQESSAEHGGGWKQRWDGCECHRPRHVWSVNTHRDVSLWFCHTRNTIIKKFFPFVAALQFEPASAWVELHGDGIQPPTSELFTVQRVLLRVLQCTTHSYTFSFFLAATFKYSYIYYKWCHIYMFTYALIRSLTVSEELN